MIDVVRSLAAPGDDLDSALPSVRLRHFRSHLQHDRAVCQQGQLDHPVWLANRAVGECHGPAYLGVGIGGKLSREQPPQPEHCQPSFLQVLLTANDTSDRLPPEGLVSPD